MKVGFLQGPLCFVTNCELVIAALQLVVSQLVFGMQKWQTGTNFPRKVPLPSITLKRHLKLKTEYHKWKTGGMLCCWFIY